MALVVVGMAHANDLINPAELIFWRGAFGPWRQIHVKDGQVDCLSVSGHSWDSVRQTFPSDKEWHKFRKGLDRLNVWSWQDAYVNSLVLQGFRIFDGESWSLTIKYSDKSLESSGANAFPGNDGVSSDESTDEFESFFRSLHTLLPLCR
jgi:hypothetical protein